MAALFYEVSGSSGLREINTHDELDYHRTYAEDALQSVAEDYWSEHDDPYDWPQEFHVWTDAGKQELLCFGTVSISFEPVFMATIDEESPNV